MRRRVGVLHVQTTSHFTPLEDVMAPPVRLRLCHCQESLPSRSRLKSWTNFRARACKLAEVGTGGIKRVGDPIFNLIKF
jgi:hypothetical protein